MRLRAAIVAAVFVAVFAFASSAYAVTLYVGGSAASRGVGGARLGSMDNYAASHIGIPRYVSVIRDTSYSRAVLKWRFGGRLANGHYPVEMYAYDGAGTSDPVFQFNVWSGAYKTTAGVGVGSTAAYLTSKYKTTKLSPNSGSYDIYRYTYYGSRPYTDFYVTKSTQKVSRIYIYK
jgi:hypothetical protein